MPLPRLLAVVVTLSVLAACAPVGEPRDGRLHVTAAFYPLQYVAERVGGSDVDVTSLTHPGAEPHDLELTSRDVAGLQDADLVVYLKGFQPAVDAALSASPPQALLDASSAASLDLTYTPVSGPAEPPAESHRDPHFWLDPLRLLDVATALERSMAAADPTHAGDYAANLSRLATDLKTLDHDLSAGLSDCTSRDLVTSHNAFGYLAERYDLHQVGISGLSPEAEPDPRQLARVATYVRDHHVRTVYFETLVSPDIADTVARETGARTAVLDPLEGLSDASAGTDYLSVMRSNLTQLKEGQPCP